MSPDPGSVLDASAVLAYLQREPGFESVRDALETGAAISAVNLAEVLGRITVQGKEADDTLARLKVAGLAVEPFLEEDALVAGGLRAPTRELGLSLGDRACLALALRLERRAITSDRTWLSVAVGAEVEVIR